MLLFKSNIYVWGILRVLPKFLQAFILAKVLNVLSRFLSQPAEYGLNPVTKLNISRRSNPKMTKLACKDNPSEPVYITRILTHETL